MLASSLELLRPPLLPLSRLLRGIVSGVCVPSTQQTERHGRARVSLSAMDMVRSSEADPRAESARRIAAMAARTTTKQQVKAHLVCNIANRQHDVPLLREFEAADPKHRKNVSGRGAIE